MRGEALAAVINNHAELMELWNWSLSQKMRKLKQESEVLKV